MNDLGTIRKVDELGRIVLPVEGRRALSIQEGDSVHVSWDEAEGRLILQKALPSCFCCQSSEHLTLLPNHWYLCEDCLRQCKPLV